MKEHSQNTSEGKVQAVRDPEARAPESGLKMPLPGLLIRLAAPPDADDLRSVHAGLISRSRSAGVTATSMLFRQLQGCYGNLHVQRAVDLSRREDEEEVPGEVEQTISRKRGGGQALDRQTAAQMGNSFNADFSAVRVHADQESDVLNRRLNARAFTTGQDIFFRDGNYAPGSSAGRELLAHELTHVVQQSGGVQCKMTVGRPDDPFEREAEATARTVMRQEETEEEEVQTSRLRSDPGALKRIGRKGRATVARSLVMRDLRTEFHGQWDEARSSLVQAFSGVGGIIDRQKGAVSDFCGHAGNPDPPSVTEQILIAGINIVLGAALPGVGTALKAVAQGVVRASLRGTVNSIIDSMVDSGKGAAQGAVTTAWAQGGGSQASRLLQFAETQRRALESIAQVQVRAMLRELARLRSSAGEEDEWEAADALNQAFQRSLRQAYDQQFNKVTDTWFTMQVTSVGPGARPGVLQITLNRRYPHQGQFSIAGGNLVGGGATEEIRRRLAARPLEEIGIPKVIRMNGQMGYGVMDCAWHIQVTGEAPPSSQPAFRAPASSLDMLAGPQRVVGYGGHQTLGWPWLAAFRLRLEDLASDDPRNTAANRSAGAEEVWQAVKDLTPGRVGNSSW